jgi:hypothetical protein
MLFKHFFLEKIAHSSYILAGSKSCAVIDPQRIQSVHQRGPPNGSKDYTISLKPTCMPDFVYSGTRTWQQRQVRRYMPRNPAMQI